MENEQASVPFFIHEANMARMERANKRLCVTIVTVLAIALIMFVINNVLWMKYTETQVSKAKTEVVNAGVYQQSDQGPDM